MFLALFIMIFLVVFMVFVFKSFIFNCVISFICLWVSFVILFLSGLLEFFLILEVFLIKFVIGGFLVIKVKFLF